MGKTDRGPEAGGDKDDAGDGAGVRPAEGEGSEGAGVHGLREAAEGNNSLEKREDVEDDVIDGLKEISIRERKFLKLVLYDNHTKARAWRILNPDSKWKNQNSMNASAGIAWARTMRKVKSLPTVMKAMGLDTPTLVGKMNQLLNAKKMIYPGGSGTPIEVDDNQIQMAALELALKKTHPDPPANGGIGFNLNLQANFQIGHPGKEKDSETWEKKAQLVIAPAQESDGTPTKNSG